MAESNWAVAQMYCPNCGTLNAGCRDTEGKIRFSCRKCGLVMVRSYKSRRQDRIDVTIPRGTRHSAQ